MHIASVIVKGGQPSAIKIEHCGVEAYVDYVPSRGVVHKQPDTWIPFDPSFKERVIYKPEDITSHVYFDSSGYLSRQQTGYDMRNAINAGKVVKTPAK